MQCQKFRMIVLLFHFVISISKKYSNKKLLSMDGVLSLISLNLIDFKLLSFDILHQVIFCA